MAGWCRQFAQATWGGSLVTGATARGANAVARVLRTIGYTIVAVLIVSE